MWAILPTLIYCFAPRLGMNPGFTHRETDANPRYDHLTGYERDNHKKPVTDRCSPQILPAMISIPLTKLPLPRRKNKKLPEYFILYFFFIYNVCLFCFFCTSPIPVESFPSLFWPCCQPITTWLQHNQRAVGILEDCTAACSWWPEIPLCRQIHAQVDTTAVAVLYKTNPSESPHHCVGIHKVFHWSLFSGYSMCWLRSATHHNQVM